MLIIQYVFVVLQYLDMLYVVIIGKKAKYYLPCFFLQVDRKRTGIHLCILIFYLMLSTCVCLGYQHYRSYVWLNIMLLFACFQPILLLFRLHLPLSGVILMAEPLVNYVTEIDDVFTFVIGVASIFSEHRLAHGGPWKTGPITFIAFVGTKI